jgi:hypothetical protein
MRNGLSPNSWVAVAALAYPVIWFLLLYQGSPPAPWWLLDFAPSAFLVVVLPTAAIIALANARTRGFAASWPAILFLGAWLALVALFVRFLLNAASASV